MSMTKQTVTRNERQSDTDATKRLDELLGSSKQQYQQLRYGGLRPLVVSANSKRWTGKLRWLAVSATLVIAFISVVTIWPESNGISNPTLASLSMPGRPSIPASYTLLSQVRKASQRLAFINSKKYKRIRFRVPKRPRMGRAALKQSNDAVYKRTGTDVSV